MVKDEHLARLLQKRAKQHLLRSLSIPGTGIDFFSNDYLGLAGSRLLSENIRKVIEEYDFISNGATGSRLLSGNSKLYEETEKELAGFHKAESALIFNSGYDANLGLLSSVPQKGDIILYDELIHASLRDGIRLSFAQAFSFEHNSLDDLKEKAAKLLTRKAQEKQVYIVMESLYSMDGDIPDLKAFAEYCRENNFLLIVDEAHANGIFGKKGEGLIPHLGLEEYCFARIYTFGKALGIHGAAIAGSGVLKQFLVNFARSFIYTTALPPHSILAIREAYSILPGLNPECEKIKSLSAIISKELGEKAFGDSASPIRTVRFPGNEKVREAASILRNNGFEVRPILNPTVPAGEERIRICLHAYNTTEEVYSLCNAINALV